MHIAVVHSTLRLIEFSCLTIPDIFIVYFFTVDGHLCFFQYFILTNNAAMNIPIHVSWCTCVRDFQGPYLVMKLLGCASLAFHRKTCFPKWLYQ